MAANGAFGTPDDPSGPDQLGPHTAESTGFWDTLPQELTESEQWVAWDLEIRDGKPTKVPYCDSQRRAKVNDPSTWLSFDQAVTLAKQASLAGVGYVFSQDDPYTGIDLDECRDPVTGELRPWATALVAKLSSYSEVSPSGEGAHVIVRATVPGQRCRKGQIEMYDQKRFFCMTGHHLEGTSLTIEPRQTELNELYRDLFSTAEPSEPRSKTQGERHALGDDEILKRAVSADNGGKFHSLFYEGNWEDYASQSEADQALCNILAFWTRDPAQINRLFRRSSMYRQKWDEARGEVTYGDFTIGKALERVDQQYVPGEKKQADNTPSEPLEVTLEELAANPDLLKGPKPVSPWLAWQGDVTLLVGREKFGKSTLASQDAAAAAIAGRKVMWLNCEESPNRVATRLLALNPPEGSILTTRRFPQSWEEVEQMIKRVKPDIVYVDSQASFIGLVESKLPEHSEGERWHRLMLRFKQLALENDAAVVVLMHATKATGDYRGSSGIAAAVDTIITMKPVEGRERGRRLESLGRWGRPSRVLQFDGANYSEMDPANERPKSLTDHVLEYVSGNPGCTKIAVRANVTGQNGKIDQALEELMNEKRIEDRGYANRCAYYIPTDLDQVDVDAAPTAKRMRPYR